MFYYIAKFFLTIYLNIFFKVKINGKQNQIKKGPFIVCSNHSSMHDPTVIAMCFDKKVRYLAKKELFTNIFSKILLHLISAYPVDREGIDIKAYKKTLQYLRKNSGVGIFFQGGRRASFDGQDIKKGVILFAIKGKSPIVPVGINSNYKFFSKLTVNIGHPIYYDKYYDKKVDNATIETLALDLNEKIKELLGKV